ncbi:MAG: AbrB/MazE/SpoVT family DNA-binding domain-containing protein [Candidatus Brocadia sp. AMX2]|uniref:AbrB/MazE/SpoVT family DNA-binding domain-containing protein n=1 Tax=Candidatus Brocadia TaxID=380240 RepID=UPI0006961ECF|nr:MAG: AbrB/MazE/SpoVT family DNA-binding domain-containing protein [Candidatus Brocadia sp. AMX2]MBC6933546.1 AbrB/MazE/SpoVT family DNA-binding domain-containing protein [Candidatus Brocadia sp.]MBL1170411.1 AbrB/MazE/SpoVT family DNA-binding domain-containing protein [Candidatus Brocadia sp. AMX1]NOG41018.1 AbrB/MazE/SpoVT family DNA-binding domain-containing protein [Planctomycetota bacterium]NUO07048.1 AbrB/MazE/SpoVT family DNA-binding domain-containing protein [Candidatus Brocadia sinic
MFYRSYYCFTGDLSTESVKVSPKYQVVIPQSIREALKIHPGEKFHILQYESRIEFIPEKEMKSMRGFLKGIDTTVKWDNDRI